MGLIELLLLLILLPIGICAVVCCIGWWGTVRPRLEHQQEMFRLAEQSKLNAVTVQERQSLMIEGTTVKAAQNRQMRESYLERG